MRLKGQMKLGYYPTPTYTAAGIADILSIPAGATLLDPCCGDGAALVAVSKGRGETYGIELDWARGESARKSLNHVVRGDAFEATVADEAFSLVFLNPPYDFAGIEDEAEYDEDDSPKAGRARQQRLEERFLALGARKVMRGGIAVLIVPKPVIYSHPRFARAYLGHFEHLAAVAWPEGSRKSDNPFRQTILVGRRREAYKRPVESDLGAFQALIQHADSPLSLEEGLASAWQLRERPIKVPAAPKQPVEPFRSRELDPGAAIEIARRSPLWQDVRRAAAAGWEGRRETPPLPLRQGHIALILSTGLLDGVVGQGSTRHVVKGRVVRQRVQVEEQEDEHGNVTLTEQERVVVEISALDLAGGVFTFTSASEAVDQEGGAQ